MFNPTLTCCPIYFSSSVADSAQGSVLCVRNKRCSNEIIRTHKKPTRGGGQKCVSTHADPKAQSNKQKNPHKTHQKRGRSPTQQKHHSYHSQWWGRRGPITDNPPLSKKVQIMRWNKRMKNWISRQLSKDVGNEISALSAASLRCSLASRQHQMARASHRRYPWGLEVGLIRIISRAAGPPGGGSQKPPRCKDWQWVQSQGDRGAHCIAVEVLLTWKGGAQFQMATKRPLCQLRSAKG